MDGFDRFMIVLLISFVLVTIIVVGKGEGKLTRNDIAQIKGGQ